MGKKKYNKLEDFIEKGIKIEKRGNKFLSERMNITLRNCNEILFD